jgi:hypothetical protein
MEIPMLDDKEGRYVLEPMGLNERRTTDIESAKLSVLQRYYEVRASEKQMLTQSGTTNLANMGRRVRSAGSLCARRRRKCAQHVALRCHDLLLQGRQL